MAAILVTNTTLKTPPPIPAGKRYVRIFDAKVTGLYFEVRERTITAYLRFHDERRRDREVKIGRYGDLTLDQIKRRASELKAEVQLGRNPLAEVEARRAILTVKAFYEERYEPHVKERLRSAKNTAAYKRRIVAAFGNKALDEVTPADIADLRRKLQVEGLANGTVNRVLADVRRMFNLSLKWRLWRGENPAASPGLLPEEGRTLVIDTPAVGRMMTALDAYVNRNAAAAIFMLAVTGARKSEVVKARWDDVDLERGVLTVPASRSKSKRARYIPLSEVAVQCLRIQHRRRVDGNDYVFPGAIEGRPLESVTRAWQWTKRKANLPADLRLHDLRHTFATTLAQNGIDINQIAHILGHSTLAVTRRYTNFQLEHLSKTVSIPARDWNLVALSG